MTEPISRLTAVAAPLLLDNIDTDAIIPSREIRSVGKTELANGLFAGWRYTAVGGGQPDPSFVLNQPAFANAQILLTGANVGCGSSREHAAWALVEYGFRAIIAPSFNPIFYVNCVRNGIVPVILPAGAVAALSEAVKPDPQLNQITIDVFGTQIVSPHGVTYAFSLDSESRYMLLEGLDAIDLTMRDRDKIESFLEADRVRRGWAYRPVARP